MEQTLKYTGQERRALTRSEIQSVELFRVAYFAGRRVGIEGRTGPNPFPDPNDELHAAWNLGRFSGLRRAAEAEARRKCVHPERRREPSRAPALTTLWTAEGEML